MKKSKATKRTLLLSVLAMLLCMVMLVGTTFAWFTDSASTLSSRVRFVAFDFFIVSFSFFLFHFARIPQKVYCFTAPGQRLA